MSVDTSTRWRLPASAPPSAATAPPLARRTAQIELVAERAASEVRDIGNLDVQDMRECDADGLADEPSGDDAMIMTEFFWFDGPCREVPLWRPLLGLNSTVLRGDPVSLQPGMERRHVR